MSLQKDIFKFIFKQIGNVAVLKKQWLIFSTLGKLPNPFWTNLYTFKSPIKSFKNGIVSLYFHVKIKKKQAMVLKYSSFACATKCTLLTESEITFIKVKHIHFKK